MPQKKKPTMKEVEAVTNNIINDMNILNRKIDSLNWGFKTYLTMVRKLEDLNDYIKDLQEKNKKENNEGTESPKASTEADSGKSS